MANEQHVALLRQGVAAWNAWREQNDEIVPDLAGIQYTRAELSGANLRGANLAEAELPKAVLVETNFNGATLPRANLEAATLCGADLDAADLSGAKLIRADLRKATLSGAILRNADLREAKLREATLLLAQLEGADLREADLSRTRLYLANFSKADLRGADLNSADLFPATFEEADLRGANLNGATLRDAHMRGARLNGAWLESAVLVDTDFTGADLSDCKIYGISAWGLKLEGAIQQNLVIAPDNEPAITVDSIEVAQFIYLMLSNQKIRDVIDTITSKVVLILGRFTDERMAVLRALRNELRKRNYLPVLYDFEKPGSRSTDETITLLARMAKFVIADISDARSVLQELRAIVPVLPSVPVQTIISAAQEKPGMFDFYDNMRSFLEVHRYTSQNELLADLAERVILPAELKIKELRARNRS